VFFVDIGPFWQPECAQNPRRTPLSTAAGSYLLLQRRKLGQGTSLGRVLTQNTVFVESAVRMLDTHGFFARFEWVQKDELFPVTDPFHAAV
jgi:hypothetical protein